MRTAPAALLTAAVLVTTLAACAPSGSTVEGCEPFASTGAAVDTVTAGGALGSTPDAEFPTPLITEGLERTVLESGDGDVVPRGGVADVEISVYSGENAEPLIATAYDDEESLLRTAGEQNAIDRAIACAQVGSRVAATATASEAFAPGALAQYGVEDDATLVLVIDVVESFLGKADGVNQLPQSGLPAVVTAVDGTPGITIPSGPIPDSTQISAIKGGDGDVVEEGDTVVLKYSGWLWEEDPTTFDSTWEAGSAAEFEMVSLEDQPSGLVPGFVDGVVGQKVGSQILIVIAPEDGYPEGQAPPAIPAGSTMIFVVDILGIQD